MTGSVEVLSVHPTRLRMIISLKGAKPPPMEWDEGGGVEIVTVSLRQAD